MKKIHPSKELPISGTTIGRLYSASVVIITIDPLCFAELFFHPFSLTTLRASQLHDPILLPSSMITIQISFNNTNDES